jgi:hypothetical protein
LTVDPGTANVVPFPAGQSTPDVAVAVLDAEVVVVVAVVVLVAEGVVDVGLLLAALLEVLRP